MKRNGLIIGLMLFMIFFLIFSSYAVDPKSIPAKPAPETLAKPAEKPLPDLVVERVWLDAQSQINFQIKNAGKGEIPDSEHNQGVVKVDFGKGHEDFYFSRASSKGKSSVDPKGVLKKPGGSVQYDTKIKVDSPLTVTVVVDEGKKIAESNDHNNSSAPTTLTPPSLSFPEKTKVTQPEEKPTIDKELKVTQAVSPAFKKPGTPVLIKENLGIDIISPGEGWVLTAGKQFGLKFKSNLNTASRVIHISLWRLTATSAEKVSEQRWTESNGPLLNPGATMIMEQQIPESAREGVYFYRVSVTGANHGTSDRFGVRPAGAIASIQVVTPGGGGEHWKTGSSHTIRWYFRGVGTTAPERWSMALIRAGGSIGNRPAYTKSLGSGVERQWLGDKWEYTHQWPIPQNFPVGDYKMSISGEAGKRNVIVRGEGSLNFTIGGGDWNLKISRLYTDPVSGNLMAEVINERPTVSGRVNFRVNHIDRGGHELQRWDIMRPLSGGEKEVVDLGKLGPLAGAPPSSGPDVLRVGQPRFKVTIDTDNRIDEKNEEDNSHSGPVSYYGLIGAVAVLCLGYSESNPTDYLGICEDYQFTIVIYNFGTQRARLGIFVTQDGYWATGRELSPEHHRDQVGTIYAEVDPGKTYVTNVSSLSLTSRDLRITRQPSRIEIKIVEATDTASWIRPNPFIIQLR